MVEITLVIYAPEMAVVVKITLVICAPEVAAVVGITPEVSRVVI